MTLRVRIAVPTGQEQAAAIVTYDRSTVTPSGGIVLQPGQEAELTVHAGSELRIGETAAAEAAAPAPAPELGPPGGTGGGPLVGDSAA